MTARYQPIDRAAFQALGLAAWTWHGDAIHAEFECGSFARAGRLVAAISAEADRVDHHPDLDLRYPDVVRVEITTHAIATTSTADVALARSIDALVAGLG